MGYLSFNLALKLELKVGAVKKKCLDDAAKKVDYWFWQQKMVDYLM